MLYAVFMSAVLPPFPRPEEPVGEPELLQLGSAEDEPCLRADAARNRAKLLDAAARLIAEHGVAGVTMEAVAAAAQVGKGTVFRRFGDRTGLLMALLDHSSRTLQADFLAGPPPLGPGAPPVDRLRAFGVALLYRSAEQLDLQLAAQPEPTRRFDHPSMRALTMHVTMLLRQIVPKADCDLLAQTFMGYLDPALIHHLTRQRGMSLERLEAGWTDLVAQVTGTEPPR
ncbi:TetR/AcrR family transcriptional regulator [Streptomyces sp. NBC_00201]|uniref:TetR/AcrR family transcriptional regulator n=1 Tax=unclassified Streptomyces TaxID=2593676 RepID=UPI002258E250|nr:MULTISPECIES: TetR/AcrR family transcriptional regulator [unclassified Streptomyces]MCX5063398.1 TetR/AcrR family transcriptional regulator [Streptomyces sp. NBC_00452]MCX5251251.1 TetR/AcrR family transcriptional regulator [Streptomyces sp. NBC_00201]MCX5294826.1 TetR/AcrR family transcriptional regulator [Streptomyces sp. NBC_00183]